MEDKSAVFATDVTKWVGKHITAKFDAYLRTGTSARLRAGTIGFRFTAGKPVDAAFEQAIATEIRRLRAANPDVQILLIW